MASATGCTFGFPGGQWIGLVEGPCARLGDGTAQRVVALVLMVVVRSMVASLVSCHPISTRHITVALHRQMTRQCESGRVIWPGRGRLIRMRMDMLLVVLCISIK